MADPHDPNPLPSDAEASAPRRPSESSRGPAPSALVDETATPDIRAYTTWIHLGTLIASIVLSPSFGLFPLIVAGAMWLARKSDHPFIDDHGREATNFQISMLLLHAISVAVSVLSCGVLIPVTVILSLAITVLNIVGLILAAIAANKGQIYRYPACIRLIGPPGRPSGTPAGGGPDA